MLDDTEKNYLIHLSICVYVACELAHRQKK